MIQATKLVNGLLVLLLLALHSVSFALDSDRNQKLYIEADSVQMDNLKGVGIYIGNVKMDQGSTHVRGDKVITYYDENNQLTKAIAYGKEALAEYWTTPQVGKPEVHANGKELHYLPLEDQMIAIGNAVVTQGVNTFHGPKIVYNSSTQIVTSPASSQGRTRIVLYPDSTDKKR